MSSICYSSYHLSCRRVFHINYAAQVCVCIVSDKYDFDETENESNHEVNQEESEDEEPSKAIFSGKKAIVGKEDADRISQQGFYGERLPNAELELSPIEMLHLIERSRIVVETPAGNVMDAEDIVSQVSQTDKNLWSKYLVFRDLRSRGYAVRSGFGSGIGFRVYERGDKPGNSVANQLVYVLKEGNPISLNELDLVTETAATSRKELVFALVDQNGEVNYYTVARMELQKIGDYE
ncbi:tRNA-intron lyase [Candidatus Thorarchaeota archaeon]|nr:MAG: tRNA-intron lyase [Candidatus Thorarchaeota archaeon]